MKLLERLQLYLEKSGADLPSIRYFNGLNSSKNSEPFCDSGGEYKGKTLEESLDKFLKEKGF